MSGGMEERVAIMAFFANYDTKCIVKHISYVHCAWVIALCKNLFQLNSLSKCISGGINNFLG